jgi:hypothetical protein
MTFSKIPAQGQLLEREDTGMISKAVETPRQVDIKVHVKAAKTIDGKVTKEVDALDWKLESAKYVPILGELPLHEVGDCSIIEEAVLVIGMEEASIYRGCLTGQRQVGI